MPITKREVLAAGGGVTVLGAFGIMALGCNSNIDDIDESYEGSRTTVKGTVQTKARDGSRLSLDGENGYASVRIQSPYHREVDDEIDTGDCVEVEGFVANVDTEGDETSVRLESGSL